MPRRSFRARSRQPQPHKTSKQLDLLLLAGCSCLLTIVYHPTTDTLKASPTPNGSANSTNTVAVQVSRTTTQPLGVVHLGVPPEREKLRDEEEDA